MIANANIVSVTRILNYITYIQSIYNDIELYYMHTYSQYMMIMDYITYIRSIHEDIGLVDYITYIQSIRDDTGLYYTHTVNT